MSDPVPFSPSRRVVLGGGLALGGLVALVGGWHLMTRTPADGARSLSVADAHAQAAAGDILLIDIRQPREWRATGVGIGAHPLDMRQADFADRLARIAGPGGKNRPIALICARGGRSARLARRLTKAGWTRIIDVPEGMLGSAAGPGWRGAGLPVAPWTGTEG